MIKFVNGFGQFNRPIQCKAKLPFEIDENLIFDKPNPSQLKVIKNYLNETLGVRNDYRYQFQYANGKYLKRPDWLYYVVNFKEKTPISPETPSPKIYHLNLCFLTLFTRLAISPVFLYRIRTWYSRFAEDWEHYNEFDRDIFILTKQKLDEIKSMYKQVNLISLSHPEIYHSFRLLADLPRFRGYNELFSLGLFSIIESLITHNPISDIDSISRQIKTKMALLEKRINGQFEYSMFEEIPPEKIWSKLYQFRSMIAHGGNLDFKNQLKVLNDSYNVQCFLEDCLKKLLQFALKEPDLIIDLKAC